MADNSDPTQAAVLARWQRRREELEDRAAAQKRKLREFIAKTLKNENVKQNIAKDAIEAMRGRPYKGLDGHFYNDATEVITGFEPELETEDDDFDVSR